MINPNSITFDIFLLIFRGTNLPKQSKLKIESILMIDEISTNSKKKKDSLNIGPLVFVICNQLNNIPT